MNRGMVRRLMGLSLVLALVVTSGACGGPQGLPLGEKGYIIPEGALVLRIPVGWQVGYDSNRDTIVSQDLMSMEQHPFVTFSGPSPVVVYIQSRRIQDLGPGRHLQIHSSRRMVQTIQEVMEREEGIIPGEIRDGGFAGKQAAYADWAATAEDGTEVAGRVLCVHLDRHGVVVLAKGERSAWEAFIPTFETMMRFAHLDERQ